MRPVAEAGSDHLRMRRIRIGRSLSIPHASRVTIVPQIAGNLGQRLNALDQTLRLQGMQHLFFIGSDAPELLADDYAMARDALQHTDVALIPAADGGVVLMANRRPWPDLSNLPWSSNHWRIVDQALPAGEIR